MHMRVIVHDDGRIEACFDVHPRAKMIADASGKTLEELVTYWDELGYDVFEELQHPFGWDWSDAKFATELFDRAWSAKYGSSQWETETDATTEAEVREEFAEFLRGDEWGTPPTEQDRQDMTVAFEAALRHDGRACREALYVMFARWDAEERETDT
jgi:hypothetical protein